MTFTDAHRALRAFFERAAPVSLVLVGLLLADTPGVHAAEFNLPQGPNRDLVYGKCRQCHDLQYVVESKGLTPDAWSGLLEDMEGLGVVLTPDERQKIQSYLSTYMSSNPPPAPSIQTAAPADGQALFVTSCSACHQANGAGIKGQIPPLAENPDLFLSKEFPVKVVLYGMEGKIEVKGQPFNAEMPSFGHLSDTQVSAVLNYVRANFGNSAIARSEMKRLTPEDVMQQRVTTLTPQKVLAYRASLK